MVIIAITGGIGNQLFQYAFAKVIEQRLGVAVYLTDRTDVAQILRPWELNNFSISLPCMSYSKVKPRLRQLNKFLYRITGAPSRKPFKFICIEHRLLSQLVTVDSSSYDDFFSSSYHKRVTPIFSFIDSLDPLQNYLLDGYWQYAALVNSIKSSLRKDLCFVNAPTSNTNKILEQIKRADNPVAIHMRTNWCLGARDHWIKIHLQRALDISYYQKALEVMRHRLNSPQFFVFSDDIQRASALLKKLDSSKLCYIDSADRADWEDMFLMRHCKHFVLSNSTFSWWGCWLAGNKRGITIMPNNWEGYISGCLVSDQLEISKGTIRL